MSSEVSVTRIESIIFGSGSVAIARGASKQRGKQASKRNTLKATAMHAAEVFVRLLTYRAGAIFMKIIKTKNQS